MKIETISGYPVTYDTKDACIEVIKEWIDEGMKRKYFVCANPHSLEVARKDKLFEKALMSADLSVPDGIGIVIASKILGGNIRQRVTGSDIFLGLSEKLNEAKKCRYFFLGSTEENLEKITARMRSDFPDITVAGVYSPPFRDNFSEEENRLMVQAVNNSRPDVLWIGMTAPKQEKWIYQNRGELDVKFIGAIGAVFDFYSGKVKRSHAFFRQMGLEWLPRLVRQPVRLWRRNFVSNPSFILRVISQRIRES